MKLTKSYLTLALATCLVTLSGCGGADGRIIPTMEVKDSVFKVEIQSFGELQASDATFVQLPDKLRGRQGLAWLAIDGKSVEKDELVARLDDYSTLERIEALRKQLQKLDFQSTAKRKQLEKEDAILAGKLELLKHERADAQAKVPKDEYLIPKMDLIDAKVSLELIEIKLAHVERERKRAKKTGEAEQQIFALQRQRQQRQLNDALEALENLDVFAPHAGVFLRSRDWRGMPLSIGSTLWGDDAIGKLPDTSKLEAKVFVLESEAAGLTQGLRASVLIDAFPDEPVGAEVTGIQAVANPIERDSPIKYFQVILSLDHTDSARMRPGGEVRATIQVAEQRTALTVPNQAVFLEDEQSWVFVQNGNDFERRAIDTGQRSVSRTVVTEGIAPGEVVALVHPNEETS